ncbi:MAG: SDR family oxidoreductase, partial [Bacteroidota bacterium]|nr:SDR family oxidoreductase [Bacteroidota bacterium]
RSIAVRLAKEGHNLIITSRTERELRSAKEEIESFGAECSYFAGDVADPHFVNNTVEEVLKSYGWVDHLINNAGIGIIKKVVDSKLEEFQRQINTNLYGIYNFTKAVLPGMIDRRSGSIINISSLAGKNSFVGGTMYSASKHAVMGFTKSLMLEVREYNIRTVVICPGSVESSFGRDSSTDPRSKAQILMPEDVADVVVAVIKLPVRALMSEIDLRPTNPSK